MAGRIGTSKAEQVVSSGFKFSAGYGEIVSAEVGINKIGEYDPSCGFFVGLQRLDSKYQPTSDDVVIEFLGAGAVTKFGVSNAKGNDDMDPTLLEAFDADGNPNGVTGNCLYSLTGGGPDKKAKMSKFSESLENLGFPSELLNGYAPNLVGLQAFFTQEASEKGDNFTGKNDPTHLIAKDKIIRMPGQTSASAKKAAAPVAAAKRPAPAPAPVAATAAAKPPVAVAKPTPVAAVAPPTEAEVAETAASMMEAIAAEMPGQAFTLARLKSKIVVKFVPLKVPQKFHKPVQAMIGSDEIQDAETGKTWFQLQAEAMGWTVEGEDIVFPAAA